MHPGGNCERGDEWCKHAIPRRLLGTLSMGRERKHTQWNATIDAGGFTIQLGEAINVKGYPEHAHATLPNMCSILVDDCDCDLFLGIVHHRLFELDRYKCKGVHGRIKGLVFLVGGRDSYKEGVPNGEFEVRV